MPGENTAQTVTETAEMIIVAVFFLVIGVAIIFVFNPNTYKAHMVSVQVSELAKLSETGQEINIDLGDPDIKVSESGNKITAKIETPEKTKSYYSEKEVSITTTPEGKVTIIK
jgi:pyruvate kinase